MNKSLHILILSVVSAGLGLFTACNLDDQSHSTPTVMAGSVPTFQVDPSWPREMPNDWIMGSVTAVFVDKQDHIWVTHLPETLTPEETSAVQDPPIRTC